MFSEYEEEVSCLYVTEKNKKKEKKSIQDNEILKEM